MKNILNSAFYLIIVLHVYLLSEVVASPCVDVDIICTSGSFASEISYEILEPQKRKVIKKSYTDNFLK